MLSKVIPLFKNMMTTWEDLKDQDSPRVLPQSARHIKAGLKVAYSYYNWMDNTNAYVIAMLMNPNNCLSHITTQWDADYVNKAQLSHTIVKEKVSV
ncbi:hypothetical protein EVJ58_g6383 [Rhodofomes roseus]|uniref:Uncharacterized protein n=1 Tax=Rhodofomes roseus TaxID=34475 RepID=A0A4Y9Y9D4_9APHY|nr:hypothetical protein EVJ58_g6383 [Rhodofomes roseus]